MEAIAVVENYIKCKVIDDDELKFAMAAVMLSSLYESWQRPGAVCNCLLSEWQKGSLIDDNYVISVTEHKTGLGGTAKLVLTVI